MDLPDRQVSDQPDDCFFDAMGKMQATNLVRQFGPADTFKERKMMIEDALYAVEENMQHESSSRLNMRDCQDMTVKGKKNALHHGYRHLLSWWWILRMQAACVSILWTCGCLILAYGYKRPIEIKGTKTKKGKKETIFVVSSSKALTGRSSSSSPGRRTLTSGPTSASTSCAAFGLPT